MSWEECFYGVGVQVRMAEISAVLVAAPLSFLALLFFSCLSVCLSVSFCLTGANPEWLWDVLAG
eukprot:COSAG01_NODE_1023_length_12063_cov_25.977432_16_plen_64_part_00